jgi:hypothetical protein
MCDKFLPDWLIIWVWRALLGEIYENIRAIAVRFTCEKKLTIRYYLDRIPTEYDYESIDCIITNILANTSSNYEILEVNEEVVFSQKSIRDLDILDGLVYARREY